MTALYVKRISAPGKIDSDYNRLVGAKITSAKCQEHWWRFKGSQLLTINKFTSLIKSPKFGKTNHFSME